eukprot:TRINITY_DN5533_c0_g1_i1.p1 TRINITY_DN5533_c0_g1~~TRINITY_DN5533_c0_g1_i1.p1  ORF type:complete len:433 (+),score=200.41 TRINITY_DN5533_c0_g1_i1:57-1355(+)
MSDFEMDTADGDRSSFLSSGDDGPVPPLQTRAKFSMFLFISFLICLIAKDGLWGAFEWMPSLKGGSCTKQVVVPADETAVPATSAPSSLPNPIATKVEEVVSSLCTGHQMVFRFSFTLFVFYLIHAMVQIRECCCVSESQKNEFQAGFFCIKMLIFLVLLIACMFIPNGFFQFYADACVIGSGLFLVLQVVLLIDFIYGWNDSWAEKSEDEPRWACYLVSLTSLFYIVGIALIVVMYLEFTQNGDCNRNGTFITITLVMGVLYSMLSVKMPHGSIFVASTVFLYSCVICFSAIRNGDGSECNNLAVDNSKGITWTLVMSSCFVGMSIVWASVSAGTQRQALSLSDNRDDMDEDTIQAKNYLFFHCVMALGSMYMAMILTNWIINPEYAGDGPAIAHGEYQMWVQISSQWLAILAFVWTLIAPVLCCADRDFS